MSPAVAVLVKRCVIRYMNGDMNEFSKLKNEAKKLYANTYKNICPKCGELMANCIAGHKGNMHKAKICTTCGHLEVGA